MNWSYYADSRRRRTIHFIVFEQCTKTLRVDRIPMLGLNRGQRVFFNRSALSKSLQQAEINRFLPHDIQEHCGVYAEKNRDSQQEPGQRRNHLTVGKL